MAAFDALYESHYERLWRFAYSFVRTRAIAQEIVHDVFLALWTGREHLQIHSTLDGYLYGAVRNHALKFVRHERIVERELDVALRRHESHGTGEASPGILEHIEREEVATALERAIDGLSERHRTAILLRWKHGMRYEEIASPRRLPPGCTHVCASGAGGVEGGY